MKTQLLSVTALLVTTSLHGNIFRDLSDNLSRSSVNMDDYAGIQKVRIPNTNMYYYKFTKTAPVVETTGTTEAVIVESKPVLQHPVVVKDIPKYDPVISKTPKTEEVGAKVEEQEIDHVYGKNSPLRDDAVAAAWEKAHAASKRLEEHREYMERLRKLRLEKAAAKEIDKAKNDD